jgi:hypothetical protein
MTGSTLTMSGTTNFSGKLKSKGTEIDATSTTALSGDSLVYVGGGKIKLVTGVSGSALDSNRITTRLGIPNITVGGSTISQFLEGYFFPSVAPDAFISGGTTRLLGDNSIVNLIYTATRHTLPILSIKLNNVPFNITNGGNTQSGATGKTLTIPNVGQNFVLDVRDTNAVLANAVTSIVFNHKRFFYGDSTNLIGLPSSGITANVNLHPTNSEFASTKAKSLFSIVLSGHFFYYVIPASFGVPSFTINGLTNNDFSSQAFTYINPLGYSAAFVAWRSNNILTGTFNIAIS